MRACSFILILCLLAPPARAVEDPKTAVRIIVCEAADQSYDGKTAVAEVVRKRRASAFSCLKRADLEAFLKRQPARTWAEARRAWDRSKNSNLTKNATHYEATRFKKPSWAASMVVMAYVGDHVFYSERDK